MEATNNYRKAVALGNEPAREALVKLTTYLRGYERKAEEVKARAEKGDVKAQVELGRLYWRGLGLNQDFKKAASWYRKGAKMGNIDGQYYLASAYEIGKGVEQNTELALMWHSRAAEQGDSRSVVAIGRALSIGAPGVERDLAKAAQFYRNAAERGNSVAQYELAQFYYHGSGVEQSYEQAYFWSAVAVRAGYGGYKRFRDLMAAKLPPKTLIRLRDEVTNWRPPPPQGVLVPDIKITPVMPEEINKK